MIPLICIIQNRQSDRDRKKIKGYQGLWLTENGKLLLKGYIVSVWSDENVLGIDGDDGYTTF